MAVFCDFENVALGVRDANYEKFDIKPILERLLLKGSIVVKKAYCDWDRYKSFKATMHEANFELIEIPHVRQSGKNSADIRLVVDALDLCYTKSHVNTFVIISGDSDFSPLVSKLRENAKQVIGVGVKQSTSDLLVANCDEFIFYDDLVRESRRTAAKRDAREAPAAAKRTPDEEMHRKEKYESRKTQAIEMAVETFDALVSERGDSGKIWASMLKEAIKRRKPDFSESYYGFRTFGNLLEEAQARGLLEFGRDEKSGAYVYRSSGAAARVEAPVEQSLEALPATDAVPAAEAPEQGGGKRESRRNGRGGRKGSDSGRGEKSAGGQRGQPAAAFEQPAAAPQFDSEDGDDGAEDLEDILAAALANETPVPGNAQREPRRNGRGGRKGSDSARGEKSAAGGHRGQRGNSYAPTAAQVFDIEDVAPEANVSEAVEAAPVLEAEEVIEAAGAQREPRRNARGGRKPAAAARAKRGQTEVQAEVLAAPVEAQTFVPLVVEAAQPASAEAPAQEEAGVAKAPAKARSPRKTAAKKAAELAEATPEVPVFQADPDDTPAKSARKPAARARRPRKIDAPDGL